MTFLLVCALCAGAPAPIGSEDAAPGGAMLARGLDGDASFLPERERLDLGLPAAALAPLADHSVHGGGSGHGGGAHIGPTGIVMGVMMVAMVIGLGLYMMRGNAFGSTQLEGASAPHLVVPPPAAWLRSGG